MKKIIYSNRFFRRVLLSFAIVLMAFCVMPHTASADSGPLKNGFRDLIQKEQDVEIYIWVDKDRLSNPVILEWHLDDEIETRNGINRKFLIEESTGNTEYCVSPDHAQCFLHPDECHDCNNDEVPECKQGCSTKYYFLLYHRCAPIGGILYFLDMDEGHIHVVDSGVECDPTEGWFEVGPVEDGDPDAGVDAGPIEDGDADAGADEGMDADAAVDGENSEQDEGGSGCGVAKGGTPSLFELMLVFLMIAAGLMVFRMRP